MKELLVYCAGGFGKEVYDIAHRINKENACWSNMSFIDDSEIENRVYDANVYRFEEILEKKNSDQVEVVIASGEPEVRKLLAEKVCQVGFQLANLMDPSTSYGKSFQLDPGVIIAPLCSIQSEAILKRNSAVNTMSIIAHDVTVGENTVVSSMVNIGGSCIIGDNSYLGMGVLIKEGIKIGNNSIVGMGSVVHKDIPDGVIALGNPARPMRENVDKRVFK